MLTNKKQKISHYETYVTGQKDLGNGYFEEETSQRPVYETYYETETYQEPIYRDEPVYKTKYYYDIDRWSYEKTITTSNSDKNPLWGEANLSDRQRVSDKTEKYVITVIDSKDKNNTYELQFEDWNNLNVDQTLTIKVDAFGEIVEIVK